MLFDVYKILATSYKRFMWIDIDGVIHCVRINDELYQELKSMGIPTSQSLRFAREKRKKDNSAY